MLGDLSDLHFNALRVGSTSNTFTEISIRTRSQFNSDAQRVSTRSIYFLFFYVIDCTIQLHLNSYVGKKNCLKKKKQFVTRIFFFDKKKPDEITAKNEINRFILDLRNNPGGLLSQAIKISDFFLQAESIARKSVIRNRDR